MKCEYAFVGVPITEQIDNEFNSLVNNKEHDNNTEETASVLPNKNSDSEELDNSSDNDEAEDMDVDVADQDQENNDDVVENDIDSDKEEEPSQNCRRSDRLANSTEIVEENEEDEKEETAEKDSRKKQRNLTKDKEYLFRKAYQTYNYVFPENNIDDLHTNTVTEIACKLYWWNHLQGKSRKDMFTDHQEIMDNALKMTQEIQAALVKFNKNKDNLLDQSLRLMGTTLLNHRSTALGRLFEATRFESVKKTELHTIFGEYELFPSPTDITFPSEYHYNEFQSGQHVEKVTFLDPFHKEKKIKITAAIPLKSLNEILKKTFGNIQPSRAETKKSKDDPETEFTLTINDSSSFYEKVLFIGNEIVGCKNIVRMEPTDLRIELVDEKHTFFLENLDFDHVFKIIDEKAKAYVAPFDDKRNLPLYQDYFTFHPPIQEEDFKIFGTDIVSIVAKILGVSSSDINEEHTVVQGGPWFLCKNRKSLWRSFFHNNESFSDMSTNESEEEECDESSDDDDESLSEPDTTEKENSEKPQKRVTRSTAKEKFCRFKKEGTYYTFKFANRKYYLKFAVLSTTKEPLYYEFDGNIYSIEDFILNMSERIRI